MKHENVVITGTIGTQPTQGIVHIQEWSHSERTKRAVKVWIACWLGSIVSILIPLVHFISVPALIIAGPIAAYFILNKESVIMGGKGTCPHCLADLMIVRSPNRFPLSELCTNCYKNLRIEK